MVIKINFETKPLVSGNPARPSINIENVIDFKQYVSEDNPGYHIIRTSRGKHHLETIDHFKKVFASFENPVFISEPFDISFNFDEDYWLVAATTPRKRRRDVYFILPIIIIIKSVR